MRAPGPHRSLLGALFVAGQNPPLRAGATGLGALKNGATTSGRAPGVPLGDYFVTAEWSA